MKYTIRFGAGAGRSVQTDDRYTAFIIRHALSFKGWLNVRILDEDGKEVRR